MPLKNVKSIPGRPVKAQNVDCGRNGETANKNKLPIKITRNIRVERKVNRGTNR